MFIVGYLLVVSSNLIVCYFSYFSEIPSVKRWDDRASVSSNHQDLLDTENSSVNKDLRTLDSISTELHSRECILADIDNDSMSTDI